MLERAHRRDRVERSEGVLGDGAAIDQMRVEPVLAARGQLAARERHADGLHAAIGQIAQQSAPAAPHVEHALSRLELERLPDEVVLAPLRLLEREREVAVVFRTAEIARLPDAEPEEPVDERVREIEI